MIAHKPSVSKAQREVWEWKESLWKSVEHLVTLEEKVAAIRLNAKETIEQLKEMQRQKKAKSK